MKGSYHQINNLSWIAIIGQKSQEFLQGQLTCDVNNLTNTQACWGAHCDPKGCVIANFLLLKWQEIYYILLPESMSTIIVETLAKYALFSNVEITITTPQADLTYISTTINHKKLTSALSPLSCKNEGYIAISKDIDLTKILQQDYIELTEENWHTTLINSYISFVTPPTSSKFLPQIIMPSTQNAISFTKGCYVGQEIIARTQHLGKIKRHLQKITLQTCKIPKIGDHLYTPNQLPAGVVMSISKQKDNLYQCLAVIHEKYADQELNL